MDAVTGYRAWIGWAIKSVAILMLAANLLLVYAYSGYFRPVFESPVWVGQIIVVVGGLIEVSHFVMLRRAAGRITQPSRLVTESGLFRIVRHPMYLGDAIITVGLFFLAPTPAAALLVAFGFAGIAEQCEVEDRQMRAEFGHDAEAWAARTRKIAPFIW